MMKSEWPLSLALLVGTLLTTLWVGAEMHGLQPSLDAAFFTTLLVGADFAFPLMGILLAHELGHYLVGRRHGVPISPPYFIPMPLSLLGTMGAVIRMERIPRANALLDVGAAGPIAGFVVAVPVLVVGLMGSEVGPAHTGEGYLLEGRSLLYVAVLRIVLGPIPTGHDVLLSPMAFAGWAGLLVTMMNLVPTGQLDGGHIAYALFGEHQKRISRWVRGALPVVGLATSALLGAEAARSGQAITDAAQGGSVWLVWFVVLTLMRRMTDDEHPPVDDPQLTPGRKVVAAGCLVLFALLFMPWWIRPA